jgi:hypothetical protein
MTDTPKKEGWKIDRHIPVAIIVVILLQTLAAGWWVGEVDTRVIALEARTKVLEEKVDENRNTLGLIGRIEERVEALKDNLTRIEKKIDRIAK